MSSDSFSDIPGLINLLSPTCSELVDPADEPPEEIDPYYNSLFERNQQWVKHQLAKDPLYFDKLQAKQNPRIFWIGCSDSRVTPDALLGSTPGEIFVYRNVANMCMHTDMAFLGAMDYAVTHLKVDHIIVCGHYNCGGVKAAMAEPQYGLVDNWIRHIKDVYRFHFRELDSLPNHEERFRRFVELNVHEQVLDVTKSSVVQLAWGQGRKLWVHGWVFNIHKGNIVDLQCSVSCNANLPKAYDLGSELVDWRFSQKVAQEERALEDHSFGRDHPITPPISRVLSSSILPGLGSPDRSASSQSYPAKFHQAT